MKGFGEKLEGQNERLCRVRDLLLRETGPRMGELPPGGSNNFHYFSEWLTQQCLLLGLPLDMAG